MYQWDFRFLLEFQTALAYGLFNTLLITLLSAAFGTLFSLPAIVGQLSENQAIRLFTRFYVEFFISMPVLVLLVWIYYCLPAFGIKLASISAAVMGLSLSLSAFLAELIRGAIAAIPIGQIEAARLLNIPAIRIRRHIIGPQVIRVVAPSLVNEYVTTLKLSTVASVVSAPELLYQSSAIISQAYRPLETYSALAVIFSLLIIPLIRWGRFLERRRPWKL